MMNRGIVTAFFLLLGRFGLVHNQSPSCPQEDQGFSGKLKMDTAFLNISSKLGQPINVSGISSNCYKCPIQVLKTGVVDNTFLILKTHHSFILTISNVSGHEVCRLEKLFGERGWYEYTIEESPGNSKNIKCQLKVVKSPDNPYIPILIAFGVLFAMAVLWILYSFFVRKCIAKCRQSGSGIINEGATQGGENEEMTVAAQSESPTTQEPKVEPPKPKKRLKSLDTFRGIAITLMVFVNFGGGGYYFFEHAVWNGLLFADLVFPWFIWIMGVSITLSFRSLRRQNLSKKKVMSKITRRSVILFGLGVFTSNYGNLKFYRVPGVLQRFGICYFVVAMMQLFLSPQDNRECKGRWWDPIRDVLGLWKQWIVAGLILTAYLVVTFGLNIPGCPRGYIGPGGIGEGFPEAYNCTGGMAGYIDREFLKNHIYRWPTIKGLYKTPLPFDPEGCLGSLTSIVLVFFGVQAGHILAIHPDHKPRIIRWTIWAFLMGVIAIGLCGGTKNDGVIPINKNLWSVSFILATGATSFLLLAICYILTDVLGWWNGAPFFYPGMNSILVYVGHGILYRHFPFSWEMDEYGSHGEKLAMSMIGTGLWVLIAYKLFTKNFFLKI